MQSLKSYAHSPRDDPVTHESIEPKQWASTKIFGDRHIHRQSINSPVIPVKCRMTLQLFYKYPSISGLL
jgi:hypothetical protein